MNTPFVVSQAVTITERRDWRNSLVDLTVAIDLSKNVRRDMHTMVEQGERKPLANDLVDIGVAALVRELYGKIQEDAALLRRHIGDNHGDEVIDEILDRLMRAGEPLKNG